MFVSIHNGSENDSPDAVENDQRLHRRRAAGGLRVRGGSGKPAAVGAVVLQVGEENQQ